MLLLITKKQQFLQLPRTRAASKLIIDKIIYWNEYLLIYYKK
jgi:hypothetical protein